ncbi:MAG TPA: TonB-dependent receptor [Steroidobacteraceae bacterium]|jgi:TonB-dependent receptor|nr:TonB-dependent receptor [Steroidobacteraceae bacterium]
MARFRSILPAAMPLVLAGALSCLWPFGHVSTAHAADAAVPADAAAAADEKSKTDEALKEVVIVGVRENLEKSLDIKRNAPVVLDSINSTELGRFPDDDVADSLAHLPGITLERTTGGEGQKITVRGLSSEYNIVTLNNRILASDDDGRDLAFDVLPSELISGADVLKSPEASAVEGSIGGTVNLHTASPFDNPGFHGGAHAEGNYNDMSDLKGSKYSAFLTDTLADDTLGFVLGGVRSDTNIRTDSLNAYNQNIYGPATYPYNPAPGQASVPLAATPCCITFGSIFDDKRRDALSGRLEWRPSSSFQLAADALWTHLDDPQIGYNESYYFAANPDGTPWESNAVVKNGVITSVSVDNFQPEMVNNTTNRKVDTYLYGLNATWKPLDKLGFTIDAYRSTASRPEGGADTFVTAGLVNDSPVAEDILNFADVPHSLPNINVVIPPSQIGMSACPAGTASSTNAGYCSYTALMNKGLLNNNKYWSTHYVGLNGYSVHDQITGFNLDGDWKADLGFFGHLLFGVGGTHREKTRDDSSNDWTNGSGQYGTLYQTAGCPVQCNPYSFGSQGFNVVSMVSPPNFMQGAGGSYPIVLPQLNVGQLLAFLKSLNGKPNPFYCTSLPCSQTFDFAQTLPQVNPYNSYDVTEKTLSGYVQANFAGSIWSGNLGVRVVHTATTAQTASAAPVSLWTPSNTASSVQTWNVQYGAAQAIGADGSYTLALPSLNFAVWAVPDRLQLRLAVAETMSRPNLSELAPTSTNNAINGTPQLYYNGTAGLKPIKANQADISAEWYYAPHSALTLALFGKKIRDDIYQGVLSNVDLGTLQYVGGPPGTVKGTPFLWTVQAPANGANSTFTGVELTWQHIMDNGFGTHMQFTHTKSGDINAAPPTTFSVGVLYEKGPISADVTWDHQSGFTEECSQCTEVPGWPAISDAFNWVTASLHYHFYKGFEVYLEGKNLSNSIARTYLNGNPLLPWAPGQSVGASESGTGVGYSSYGRTYVLGAAYRF